MAAEQDGFLRQQVPVVLCYFGVSSVLRGGVVSVLAAPCLNCKLMPLWCLQEGSERTLKGYTDRTVCVTDIILWCEQLVQSLGFVMRLF